jgi:hypothetical protein
MSTNTKKMNTKNLMVSLCAVAIAMFLVVTVSAANLASNVEIEVDDINVADNPAVVAGETVAVEVTFTADVDASDVRVKAEIEGDKVDLYVMSKSFDVEAGHTYKMT